MSDPSAPYLTRLVNARWNMRGPVGWQSPLSVKHDHYHDFGYPQFLGFDEFHRMYSRNGYAYAAVNKTIAKTWQDNPLLQDHQRDGSHGGQSKETPLEAQIRQHFDAIMLWQAMAEADRRSLVGEYAGLILRIADDQPFDQPVTGIGGGLEKLVEVIPAWQGQLTVDQYGTDERDPDTYGQPVMFRFNEAAVSNSKQPRQFQVHPDRVIIWSRDGTVNCTSALEPGYNDLLDLEKVSGAGGEGFWKNAKAAPVLQVDKDVRVDEMARALGLSVDDYLEKVGDQVSGWQSGFDKLLMLLGTEAKALNITLPSPEYFLDGPKKKFAASFSIPVKILDGSQTGQRASTEDSNEWDQTNNSRRVNIVKPRIMAFVRRLVKFRILPEKDWFIDWTDLTSASKSEKVDTATKMAAINAQMQPTGQFVFKPDEIRAELDLEPLTDAERWIDGNGPDDTGADDEMAALGAGQTEGE